AMDNFLFISFYFLRNHWRQVTAGNHGDYPLVIFRQRDFAIGPYSPAKYGILGELTTGDKLVKANGLMEASTIAAILLGSVAGGV
ncbi:hypothetical protein MJI20_29500, partial [Salmonella enterica subsp. enterica serovar Anatum]|nr:hypothetical protein [Salmonella enterica subsp. enterica serovar Anatum]